MKLEPEEIEQSMVKDIQEIKQIEKITTELLSEEDIENYYIMEEYENEINKNIVVKCIKRLTLILVMIISLFVAQASHVFGANDPLAVINNLSTFIFGIIRAVGMILLGWGIVQIGLALKSHDPSQRANRFYDTCTEE